MQPKLRRTYRLLYWALSKFTLGRAVLWNSWLDGYECGMKMRPVAEDLAYKYREVQDAEGR